ncbi:MAG: hypothetical protein ACFFC3_13915 [Candidatus Odinarchaeota archaeon]
MQNYKYFKRKNYNMSDLSQEEIFVIEKIKEHGGKINYKELQTLCEEKFEGVRLILKKLKEKTYVDYEGMIPGFSAEIELLRNKEIS